MKKRITSIILVITLFTALLSLVGCGAEAKYEFSEATYSHYAYSSFLEDLNSIYEETALNLYEDGTWSIDMTLSSLDEGTYTLENGIYTFEGFTYNLQATGEETENGFVIHFRDAKTAMQAFSLHFEG
ncbi:MAG: hypothetical protein IJW49_02360 [Clostridia bacterium]|nr:hypothetical protein [Clostridia bacterium]